ncbi:uncharacterized protein LOC123537493 [Mercenaria mercenaria]|uniref:uncharacterized protein LOC123537493 n=1 Tax=Mercenaria mercenaria TaxID=6596 RepID=UPI00234FA76A|nr:uncharacterized protein LOC123537493 [Mercenaria mercenaria]XP_053384010.1 uncharacterized protein LOC123537493 [Mercenaria mercenaria]XP_053384011.1 uncharacterized protein LOC123537493 [Mercenaria mercenaria]XP_053384012.1 uncharacterized protein LOC123537493 [Mercenaria mercenaria]
MAYTKQIYGSDDCADNQHNTVAKNDALERSTGQTVLKNITTLCDTCKESGIEVAASKTCRTCEESYCDDCASVHRSQKATRQHVLDPHITSVKAIFICNTCLFRHIEVPATSSCTRCKELYCDPCSKIHSKQKATMNHTVVHHVDLAEKSVCEPCGYIGKENVLPAHLCIECEEGLCQDCFNVHTKQKATRQHTVVSAANGTGQFCQPCLKEGKHTNSEKYCQPCSLTMCTECASEHRQNPSTLDHKVLSANKNEATHNKHRMSPTNLKDANVVSKQSVVSTDVERSHDGNLTKPGKPTVVGHVRVDSICLTWVSPKEVFQDHRYQLRFKETIEGAKWSFYPQWAETSSVTLNNVKSNTEYVFQVRMVCEECEGPYSEVSDTVNTIESAAHQLLNFMYDVKLPDINIPLKKVPFSENIKARNVQGKTRKLVVGEATKTNSKERTIMLVGATGTGKSTLVDGMINHILGVNWSDPYRLTIVDLEDDEENSDRNQAVSQTKWITCYVINPIRGSRLDFTLNIIDTPGFGDTRGIERDKKIIEQIRTLFSREDESGVVLIDAVCFLVKAPDARLTPTQKYIFNAIMSLFGQDIKDNFCMLVTFADGKPPEVLSALKEAKLPYKEFFPFNNSGLFAENCGENISSFSPMFWDMGCSSFEKFFSKLTQMKTKSLRQTRDVLEQRQVIEITMENLLPKLDDGLNKVEELRVEINIMEIHKTQIEANKDFTYTVSETHQKQIDLPKGKHVTNCLNCHMTCHKDCRIPNDEDKKGCSAMNRDGYCTQCSDKCFWNIHRNTPYIYASVTVKKQKTYTEKLEKYRRAKNEKMTRKTVVERMYEELYDIEDDIVELMEKINECNNILRQIALRPDPLSVVEHIDLLIESEQLEKRAGFQARIASLQQCRKRATIGESVDSLRTDIKDTTKTITDEVKLPKESTKRRNRRGKLGFLQPVFDFFQK